MLSHSLKRQGIPQYSDDFHCAPGHATNIYKANSEWTLHANGEDDETYQIGSRW